MKRLLLSCAIVMALSSVLCGQVTTGVPPFSSTTGGPDVTNLGNLNVHFSMPVFHKPGRGMPFTFDLGYDTSVWYPVGSSGNQNWQPVGTWGWTAQTQAAIGYISYNTSTGGPIPCSPPNDNSPRYFTVYSEFVYHDIFGNSHAFSSQVSTMDQSCSTASSLPPPSASSRASDGSGFTLNAWSDPGANIVTPDGATITPPLGGPSGSGITTDRNGNQITVDGAGHITDTLGATALTISGTAPSPVVMTYTDSNNQPQHVTINYVSYTVETYFQCSGIHEYGPTSIPLVDNITYPDGSQYKFQYEATPNGSGHVTGRLGKITFPAGGMTSYTYQGIVCTDGSLPALSRQTPDGTTTYSRSNVNGSEWTTSITDALGNLTTVWTQNWQTNSYETKRQINQLVNGNQVLLRTIYTCYNGATGDCSATTLNLPINQRSVVTQLDNNWESEVNTQYSPYMLPTETDEYDWGNGAPGTLQRKTLISYAPLSSGIIDRLSSVTIQDGNGNQKALTNYYYDQGTPSATSGVPQHVAVTGSRGN